MAVPYESVVIKSVDKDVLNKDSRYYLEEGFYSLGNIPIGEGSRSPGKCWPPMKCAGGCGRFVALDSRTRSDFICRTFVCGNLDSHKIYRNTPFTYNIFCENPCGVGNSLAESNDGLHQVHENIVPDCRGQCLIDIYVKFVENFCRNAKRCGMCDRIVFSCIPILPPNIVAESVAKGEDIQIKQKTCKQYLRGAVEGLPCTSCDDLEALDGIYHGDVYVRIRDEDIKGRFDLFNKGTLKRSNNVSVRISNRDFHQCEEGCRGECCLKAIEKWLSSETTKSSGKK